MILFIFTVILFSNQIAIAQCRIKEVTEYYPSKSEYTYTYPELTKFQDGTVGHQKEVRYDVTCAWWEKWFSANKPEVIVDYWGCEECSDDYLGFIVLKKGTTSVILFNYGAVTYAIFGAKILANKQQYDFKLFPDVYGSALPQPPSFESDAATNKLRENKEKYFQSLQTFFGSTAILPLKTKSFEAYFK
jgi:hypothetical protein